MESSWQHHKLRSAYDRMLQRCYNPWNDSYKYYGGRGIKVAPEWFAKGGFKLFAEHIGLPPSPKHSVDRIKNEEDYKPGNVRWATSREQHSNKRQRIARWKTVASLQAQQPNGNVIITA